MHSLWTGIVSEVWVEGFVCITELGTTLRKTPRTIGEFVNTL